jgi:hypothetical protein
VIVPAGEEPEPLIQREKTRIAEKYSINPDQIGIIVQHLLPDPSVDRPAPVLKPVESAPVTEPAERKVKNPDAAFGEAVYGDNGQLLGFRQANGAITMGRPMIAKDRAPAEDKRQGFSRDLNYKPLGLA